MVKDPDVDPDVVVASKCLFGELFEDEIVTQLVTSSRIRAWVGATSTRGIT